MFILTHPVNFSVGGNRSARRNRVDLLTDLIDKSMADCQGQRFNAQQSLINVLQSLKIVSHSTMKAFLQFVLEEIMRTDLIWEVVKYMGSLFLKAVHVVDSDVQFCIIKNSLCFLFTAGIIKNILGCFI